MLSAESLMLSFLSRTQDRPERRYLYTDAFAVRNLVRLGRMDLALQLVKAVHQTLGQHRSDDQRRGWLSGRADHPTAAGLRIGKPLPERRADQEFDEALEWDRDGQYFHYLTQWMLALHSVGKTGWAAELLHAALRAFRHGERLYWKMSIDLSRPLVTASGQHDAVEARVVSEVLGEQPDFLPEIVEDLTTTDPLGLGSLLMNASLLTEGPLKQRLLQAAERGLAYYQPQLEAHRSGRGRLAFRELGLAIGLGRQPLGRQITDFWTQPRRHGEQSWLEHQDINEVMLASALLASQSD